MTRSYTRAVIAALVGGLLALAFLVRFERALALTLALAWPGSEGWLARPGREPVREDVRVGAAGRALDADLYRPAAPRQAILLVHGLSRAGRRHPELVRLARLLAREGTLVLVPHFPGLAAFRLDGGEVEEIRTTLRYLARLNDTVSIAGLSFGAGPALDPDRLRCGATANADIGELVNSRISDFP